VVVIATPSAPRRLIAASLRGPRRALRRLAAAVRAHGSLSAYLRLQQVRADAWLRDRLARRCYCVLSEAELRATRRSDRLFIFGSGASLNDLSPGAWQHFAQHDTLGFNWFVYQRFVRCDYHLIRGIPDTDLDASVWRPQLARYFSLLQANPCFAGTVYLVQEGFSAINGNRSIGLRLLPEDRPVYRWRKRRSDALSLALRQGLTLRYSTLDAGVNFGALLGWRTIVLVGVDLYDRRYFWLPPDETRSVDIRRGARYDQPHSRAQSGMIAAYGVWAKELEARGIGLYVYNPRSLLARVLPVYPARE
jgi:hypothetical protein